MSAATGRKRRRVLTVRSRPSTRAVNLRELRRLTRALLLDQLQIEAFDLSIFLVSAVEMTQLNEAFLRHRGSTDVLAFDYRDAGCPGYLFGEIFVCAEEASAQARRFRTSWPAEVVRYVIHGLLHLCGYDDRRPSSRQKMKRVEDRLLRGLSRQFNLRALAARSWAGSGSALP